VLRGDGPGADVDGQEEESVLGFEAERFEAGGFTRDEVAGGGGEGAALRGPWPGGVGADDVGEGFCVDGVILEGRGEDEPACGVGGDG